VSTVPDVKAALVALWTTALAPVKPRYGSRVTVTPGERLVIGDVRGTTESTSLGPARQMQERYDVTCTISVTQSGTADTQQQVTERAFALYDLAEVAVRSVAGENLGISAVVLAYVAGDFSLTEAPASDTRGPVNASIEFNVRVQARYRLP
jgi:hypothetical protein